MRPKLLHAVALAAVLACAPTTVAAQDYPTRPITFLVAAAPGGGSDTIARAFSSLLERELKQPVNVVNRTGGSGVVGHSAIANAPPDGYTIGVATIEITVFKSIGLAEITPASFTLIARIAAFDSAVIVSTDSPYKTAAQLRDAIVKGEDGKFKAGGSGQGGSWHMALGGWLKSEGMSATKVRWVPSAGGAASLQELVAGGIDFATCSAVEARALAEAGKVRVLATMGSQRTEIMPNVPTLKEATGSSWEMGSWFSIVGPKGIDPKALAVLAAATKSVHESAAFRAFLKERGFTPVWETGDTFVKYASKTTVDLGDVLGALGLRK